MKAGLVCYPSLYAPIHYNPDFRQALSDPDFRMWWESSCRMLVDMFEGVTPKDFLQCKRDFALEVGASLIYTTPPLDDSDFGPRGG